jgi:ascorbate-specific PTS system EIIC-type component UlaA
MVTSVVVAVIVVGILLVVLGANPHNTVVSHIHDAAKTLVGPFANVFSPHNAKAAVAVNWGLAALVYLIVGHIIASLLARMTPRRRPVAV